MIYNALRTGTTPKRWTISPIKLYRCSLYRYSLWSNSIPFHKPIWRTWLFCSFFTQMKASFHFVPAILCRLRYWCHGVKRGHNMVCLRWSFISWFVWMIATKPQAVCADTRPHLIHFNCWHSYFIIAQGTVCSKVNHVQYFFNQTCLLFWLDEQNCNITNMKTNVFWSC